MKKRNYNSGYTLMELMVTLSVIGVLTALAMPNTGEYVDDAQVRSASNDLISALQISRAEAVGRNSTTTLCKKNEDSNACVTDGGWEQGWLIFVDADRDATLDSGEEVIQVHDNITGNVVINGTSQVADAITFRANGRTNISSTQTLMVCDERGYGSDARGVVISILGRGSVMKGNESGQDDCLVPAVVVEEG